MTPWSRMDEVNDGWHHVGSWMQNFEEEEKAWSKVNTTNDLQTLQVSCPARFLHCFCFWLRQRHG